MPQIVHPSLEDYRLLDSYLVASAPLNNPSDNLVRQSININNVLDGFAFLQGLTDIGTLLIKEGLTPKCDCSNKAGTALLIAGTFAKRLSQISEQLSSICQLAYENSYMGHYSMDDINKFETKVQSLKENEVHPELIKYLRMKDPNWDKVKFPLKQRVGFKNTAAVFSSGNVQEEKVKGISFQRRNQRNPTGFAKFNFKELQSFSDEDKIDSSENSLSPTDAESTYEPSSTHTDEYKQFEDLSSNPNDDSTTQFEFSGKSSSSVVFPSNNERQVIDDQDADKQWEENQRHQKRYNRIRNRVPTGHPSLMRGASDDLTYLVEEYERMVSNLALTNETLANTEKNREEPVKSTQNKSS